MQWDVKFWVKENRLKLRLCDFCHLSVKKSLVVLPLILSRSTEQATLQIMRYLIPLFILLAISSSSLAQSSFPYEVQLTPKFVQGMPGLHSFAFAQHNGYWIFIGGRRDGLHARQPFNAFPASSNNNEILLVNPETNELWTTSVTGLPSNLSEQLQCTNMNFHQDGDFLYLVGGYAYAASADDHITFPLLTQINLDFLVSEVQSGSITAAPFEQIEDDFFAVTGGHLSKLGDSFYIVGGHRFDGRYNPMGMPTYTQSYTNALRVFTLSNDGALSYEEGASVIDPVHLHRRDYNLLSEIRPDGTNGLMISSGVFQPNADLPFLYPVLIDEDGIQAETSFNQYLSNYHSAAASLLNEDDNAMHHLFFGGMSQFYYENGVLMQDDLVPFVKTISRVEHDAEGNFEEFLMNTEMPNLKGSSAEFIPMLNDQLAENGVIRFNETSADTMLIGHIYGGILSQENHAFQFNNTQVTSADPSIYEVRLVRNTETSVESLPGQNDFTFEAFFEVDSQRIRLVYGLEQERDVHFYLTSSNGQLIQDGKIDGLQGQNEEFIRLQSSLASGIYMITVSLDNVFFDVQQVFLSER